MIHFPCYGSGNELPVHGPSNGDSNVQFTLKITFKAGNVILNVLETFSLTFLWVFWG